MTQYWDQEGITGTYFAETDLGGLGYAGFVYDVYYVFAGDATWANEPAPLAASGSPVLYKGEELLAALDEQPELPMRTPRVRSCSALAVAVLLAPDAQHRVGAGAEDEEERERVRP